jgi:D-xylose 1-dehydrogenase (NADP+, D-xylono-1,5-lactone-forming)
VHQTDSMDPVRWGFLGAGWLVTTRTADSLHQASNAELTAVGARDAARAASVNPKRAYASYQEVIDDPEIEAVYIALANDVHLHWILAALEAGKHVLCEKPMTMNAQETRIAFDKAAEKGLLLVEAVWMRWHPRMAHVAQLAKSGALGAMTNFDGRFTWQTADAAPPGNYRFFPEYGGGALLDIGVYPLHALLACVPDMNTLEVTASSRHLNEHGADLTTEMTLTWGENSTAEITASFEQPATESMGITFENGEISSLDNEAYASWREPARVKIGDEIETFDATDAYQLMFEAMSSRIRGGNDWLLSPAESIKVAELANAAVAKAT